MPATEQTWRNQTLLHKVFAVSCVLMLLSTIWMFAADHGREWHEYQDNSREIDIRFTEWRTLQQETDDVTGRARALESRLATIRSGAIPSPLLTGFRDELAEDAEARSATPPSFAKVESLDESLTAAAAEADEARQELARASLDLDKAIDTVDRLTADLEAARLAVAQPPAASGDAAADEARALEAAQRVERLEAELSAAETARTAARKVRDDRRADLTRAEMAAIPFRERIFDALDAMITDARFREDESLRQRKFESAKLDAARANLGLGVRDEYPPDRMQELEDEVVRLEQSVAALSLTYQAASQHRKDLKRLREKMAEDEAEVEKQLDENQAELTRLHRALEERRVTYFTGGFPFLGKKWLALPILDAFNSPRKIDNLWSEGLDQQFGSFSRVRRFDRCTTCHRAIDKTSPGTSDEPAFPSESTLKLTLTLPEERPDFTDEELADFDKRLARVFGVMFAGEGLLDRSEVVVKFVRPYSPAAQARAAAAAGTSDSVDGAVLRDKLLMPAADDVPTAADGLQVGDVVVEINADPAKFVRDSRAWVQNRLMDAAIERWDRGTPTELTILVKRGLPNPYASHPRLDLFVGSLSPHKLADFACTVCHEGQGSATAFKWASHAPDDPHARKRWASEYGWFDNHHWIFPMFPKRFAESGCVKCHHDVTELEPSDRFLDAPAPKVVHGYNLIRKNGCFGCHEINGYDGPSRRVGPDMRAEPNYFAAALQLKGSTATGLGENNTPTVTAYDRMTSDERTWIDQLIDHPEDDDTRRKLLLALTLDQEKAMRLADRPQPDPADRPRFSDYAHDKLAPLLKDIQTPGTLRKVGPSLRFVASKNDDVFMYDWIRDPSHFRPSTRMPRFFGQWDHQSTAARAVAEKFEPFEILGMVAYLRHYSQPFEYLPVPDGITAASLEERIERGKIAFQERGCLACHTHGDFPDAQALSKADHIVQGPDLTAIGAKFAPDRNPNGRQWLDSWIRQPTRYHTRTLMPDLFIEPIVNRDVEGNVTSVTDPAGDLVEYLMSNTGDWTPAEGTLLGLESAASDELELIAGDPSLNPGLVELAKVYLGDAFYAAAVDRYVERGIPESMRKELKGAERELLVPDAGDQGDRRKLSRSQLLRYVGAKTIAKYGCTGCHDIPGFEDAKPIGTGLADWGRKEPEKLAFEHIFQYLDHGRAADHHDSGPGGQADAYGGESGSHAGESASSADEAHAPAPADAPGGGSGGGHDEHNGVHGPRELPPEFYRQQIDGGNRIGFIYQKLLEPRGYDYHKEHKGYNERLRMPLFNFDTAEREAVITFVLGLVADPPKPKYIYEPDRRTRAIVEGKRILDKFNCAGCHLLEPDAWALSFPEGAFGPQSKDSDGSELVKPEYPFVEEQFPPEAVAASRATDSRNLRRAVIHGMPTLEDDGRPRVFDDEEFPLEDGEPYDSEKLIYSFDLWSPTLIDGHAYQVGNPILVDVRYLEKRREAIGGYLAKYLLQHVVAREKEVNPNAKGSEAWSWVPPPLYREGEKVRSDWLHGFLLDPYPIRPAVVLRMPRFNMSSDEASKLVNYFAARDGTEFPYRYEPSQRNAHVAQADLEYARRLEQLHAEGQIEGSPPFTGRHLDDAMKIVTDQNYCIKCHLVADYNPPGSERAKAPDLSKVAARMRVEYVRRWIAKPNGILPYTSMPLNIPFVKQDPANDPLNKLYPGSSTDQVDALVDLLMNYDAYTRQRSLIAPLVKPSPVPPAETPPAEED